MSDDKNSSASRTAIWVALITGTCTLFATIVTVIGSPIVTDWLQSRPAPTQRVSIPPTILPASATKTPIVTNEIFVNDKLEGKNPDFLTLVVRYDDKLAHVTVALSGIEQLADTEFIYMYGTYHDLIRLNSQTFRLERDYGADGYFESLIYSGSVKKISGNSIALDIPIESMPDISKKRIWGYSTQSQDRIPDEGELLFPTPPP